MNYFLVQRTCWQMSLVLVLFLFLRGGWFRLWELINDFFLVLQSRNLQSYNSPNCSFITLFSESRQNKPFFYQKLLERKHLEVLLIIYQFYIYFNPTQQEPSHSSKSNILKSRLIFGNMPCGLIKLKLNSLALLTMVVFGEKTRKPGNTIPIVKSRYGAVAGWLTWNQKAAGLIPCHVHVVVFLRKTPIP